MGEKQEITKKKLSDLRIIDIKTELENRSLDKNGTKTVLIERLTKAIKDEGHDPDEFLFEITSDAANKKSKKDKDEDALQDGELQDEEVDAADSSNQEPLNDEDKSVEAGKEDKGQLSESLPQSPPKPENAPVVAPLTVDDAVKLRNFNSSKSTDNASLIVHVDDTQSDLDVDAELKTQSETDQDKKDALEDDEEEEEDEGDDDKAARESNANEEEDGPEDSEDKTEDTADKDSKTTAKTAATKAKSLAPKEKASQDDKGIKKVATSGKNLWVSNLAPGTRAADLKTIFSKYGKVVVAKIVTNARSPGSRCFGFVTMHTIDEASKAIQHLHRTELSGRIISVEKTRHEPGTPKRLAVKSTAKAQANSDEKTKPKKAEGEEDAVEIGAEVQSELQKEDEEQEEEAEDGGPPKRGRYISSYRGRGGYGRYPRGRPGFYGPGFRGRGRGLYSRARPFYPRRGGFSTRPFKPSYMEEDDRRGRPPPRDFDRKREIDYTRQKFIERKQRDEALKLEVERERLRLEREKLEHERLKLMRAEREKQKYEREVFEREKDDIHGRTSIRRTAKRPYAESEDYWEVKKRPVKYDDEEVDDDYLHSRNGAAAATARGYPPQPYRHYPEKSGSFDVRREVKSYDDAEKRRVLEKPARFGSVRPIPARDARVAPEDESYEDRSYRSGAQYGDYTSTQDPRSVKRYGPGTSQWQPGTAARPPYPGPPQPYGRWQPQHKSPRGGGPPLPSKRPNWYSQGAF